MRIVQLCHAPQRRGAEVFAAGLAERLRERGHAVRTLYLYPRQGAAPLPLAPGDEVLGGREGHPAERLVGLHPGLLRRLRGAIRRFRPEVVQANGGATLKYAAAARRSESSAWILVYRNIGRPGDWLRGPLRRLYYRRLVMPAVAGVAAVSRSSLAELARLYRRQRSVAVIPTGVDLDRFAAGRSRAEVRRELSTPEESPVVLQVGSLTPEKRPEWLLEAFGRVRQRAPGAYLWLLGEGALRPRLERRRAARPDLPLRLLGGRDDVASVLAAADVLALASDTEGLPAAVLEAGCLGLPTVATRVGGVPECIDHGETGLLVEPHDLEAFATALADLLNDSRSRQRLGRAARSRVRERFGLGPIAGRFESFYGELLAAGRGAET